MTDWQSFKYRSLWQHEIWKKFQDAVGCKTWMLKSEGISALVVQHIMPLGLNWLEVPRGPLFKDEKSLSDVLEKIKGIGQEEKSVFVRLSPFEKCRISNIELRMSNNDHHPQISLVIDITKSEDELLAQMKPKGRYNIKVAEKHGVTVEQSNSVDEFYELLQKTGGRDSFGIHLKSYYQKMLDSMSENAQLLIAKYQSEVIAGGIFVYLDEWGIYYYGASDYKHRNLMAPYLIQWEAIKEAKKRGCKNFDLFGIAPENEPKHPWAGVTEFKKKFGGEIVEYPQAQEMVLRPFWYLLYSFYKTIGRI